MTANSTKAQRAFEMDAWFKAPGDSRLAIESDLFDFARRLLADAVEYTLYEGESNEAEAFGVENLVEFLLLLRVSAWFLSAVGILSDSGCCMELLCGNREILSFATTFPGIEDLLIGLSNEP